MVKYVKAATAALYLASGLTLGGSMVLAQAQNSDGNTRPLPPDGSNNQPYDTKAEPTNPGNVGSRPMGPAKDEKSTDPNQTKPQSELKKLDKEGRGGQQN